MSADGVSTDPKKLVAVEEYPVPHDLKTYRKFVPDLAKVAGPLHALTKKEVPFLWSPKCQSAFVALKRLAPLLKSFILETDASGAETKRWHRASNLESSPGGGWRFRNLISRIRQCECPVKVTVPTGENSSMGDTDGVLANLEPGDLPLRRGLGHHH